MKTNGFLKLAVIGFAVLTLGCKKDKDENMSDTATEMQVTSDQNEADTDVEDVATMQDDIMASHESALGRAAVDSIFTYESCAIVTITPKGNNATGNIKVDFGEGCVGQDGRTRKGVINWSFTERLRKPGAVVVTSFQNYAVKPIGAANFIMIDNASTKVTTNESTTEPTIESAVLNLKRDLNMKLVFPDANTFTYTGTKHVAWDLGVLGNRWDNIYSVKVGSTLSGTGRGGKAYTWTVNTDVVRKTACQLLGIFKPVSGVVTIQHNNKTKVVDFGDGNCDKTVTITINGTRTITRW